MATEKHYPPAEVFDMDINELQEYYPEAYEALPEPYKNDSCLVFHSVHKGFKLWASVAPGNEHALGADSCWWYNGYQWVDW